MHSDYYIAKTKYFKMLEDEIETFINEYNQNNTSDNYGLLNNARPEFIRYAITLEFLEEMVVSSNNKILKCIDIGGHLGIFSGLINKVGFEATNLDSKSHFDDVLFKNALRYMEEKKVKFIDADLMSPGFKISIEDQYFDAVIFQAVIEHLPHSPKLILDEINRILKNNGSFIMCTPNGGQVGLRLKMLRKGDWPYWGLKEFYDSEIPFLGHHRLYSINDLDSMAKWAGFFRDRERTIFFDDTGKADGSFKWRIFWSFIYRPIIFRYFERWRQVIWAVYKKIPV